VEKERSAVAVVTGKGYKNESSAVNIGYAAAYPAYPLNPPLSPSPHINQPLVYSISSSAHPCAHMQKPQPARASLQQDVSDMCGGALIVITLPNSNKQRTKRPTLWCRVADTAQQLQLTDRLRK